MSSVLDSSAVIALMRGESGADRVLAELDQAMISAVNLSEIYCKALAGGADIQMVRSAVRQLNLTSVDFNDEQAAIAASLRESTRTQCLSFADLACLALGLSRDMPVVTGDGTWQDLDIGVDVRLFRKRKAA